MESSLREPPSQRLGSMGRESMPRGGLRDGRDAPVPVSDRFGSSKHIRTDSEATGPASSTGYPDTAQSSPPWRHDYDVQAMEVAPANGTLRGIARNPIPPPAVTVRSEFPTITKSRHQQTLTCLVTIEVADNKWRPDPDDIGLRPQPPSTSVDGRIDEEVTRSVTPVPSTRRFYPYETSEVLQEMTESLRNRVDNWHGLDFSKLVPPTFSLPPSLLFQACLSQPLDHPTGPVQIVGAQSLFLADSFSLSRFGQLRLYGTLRVGKDKVSWQELECFLFAEMLICIKEKRLPPHASSQWDDNGTPRASTRCTLKGSILIKKHLDEVAETGAVDDNILTLSLSVEELPQFHLKFENRNQLKLWKQALLDLNTTEASPLQSPDFDRGTTPESVEEPEWQQTRPPRVSSTTSSWGHKSVTTAPTEYTSLAARSSLPTKLIHVPVDVVVVVPISSSMQGVKINLVRDALIFMVNTLGERDRMGLVTYGSGGGGVPVVGMTTKAWPGWSSVLTSIKPVGQKGHRADLVEGANVAMDLLMQRKHSNPIATIMLISDSSTADADSVDFVVSRAEAAK